MRAGHVVYFSSLGCTLWSWHERKFLASPVRIAVGADPGAIVAELQRLEPAPVAVLVDMIDEEHVVDTMARLARRDQRALVERKLAKAFPRTPFRAAQPQGRRQAGATEQRVLLSALTRPEPVRSLLQRLAEAQLPVIGIYSPALLASRLLDEQARSAPTAFLVLRRSNGRLQHSFFHHGELAGSRRLRAVAVTAEEDPGLFVSQIEESLRYFEPSFAASPAAPLQVLLPSADVTALQSAGVHGDGWQPRALPLAAMRRRLRIAADIGEQESERWFIELLRHPPQEPNFAPSADRHYFGLFRLRRLAHAACYAVAGAALAGALYNALAIADLRQRAAESSDTALALQAVLPGTTDEQSPEPDPLQMREAVLIFESLRAHQSDPATILATVAAAVSRQPHIRIDTIRWAAPADAAVPATDDTAGATEELPAADPGDVSVVIEGRVEPFDGAYPRAFEELRGFVEALRAAPGVQRVQPTKQPLDVNPDATFSGEVASGGAVPQAPFTVELVMRTGHEAA